MAKIIIGTNSLEESIEYWKEWIKEKNHKDLIETKTDDECENIQSGNQSEKAD